MANRQRLYYGWWVVTGLFVVLMISAGLGFYNLSVYVHVFATTYGFSLAGISGIAALYFLMGGVSGMVVARLLEHFDVRYIMIGGAALAGLSLGFVGTTDSLTVLYMLFALFGIGNAGVSLVVSTTLVTRWFPGTNRSGALSVASTGLSMGGIAITPATALLIDWVGIGTVMPWVGFLFFASIAPIAWWVIRPAPMRTVSNSVAAPVSESQGSLGWRYTDAIRSRFFILHTAGFLLCLGIQVGGIAHLYNHAEKQTSLAVAALCIQVLTAASICGRIAGGFIVARVPIRAFTLTNVLLQAGGFCVIAMSTTPSGLILGAAVFGSSVGNLLMLQPLWLAAAFDDTCYARIFSFANAITVLGVATGPLLMGILYDSFDYLHAYLVAMGLSLVAFGLLTAAGATPGSISPAADMSAI